MTKMDFKIHKEKYLRFKESAEQDRYIPSRIEDYFKAAFHLIESVVSKRLGLHIQKHQKIRAILKENKEIFEDKTNEIIDDFHEIENKLRVATSYGKRTNGEILKKTSALFMKIEDVCLKKLK